MIITEHAKQRFASRIMDKNDKTDITIYIKNHEDDIESRINKMIEYGDKIFTGRSVSEYNKNVVDVYLKDTWVVIVDKERQKVITLYSIDLGVGKEFNDQYINLMRERLDKANEKYEADKMDIVKKQAEFGQVVKSNNEIISDLRRQIKALEEQNQMYNSMINSLQTNIEIAEKDVRETVAILIGRKVF